jgi:hypothetical protein
VNLRACMRLRKKHQSLNPPTHTPHELAVEAEQAASSSVAAARGARPAKCLQQRSAVAAGARFTRSRYKSRSFHGAAVSRARRPKGFVLRLVVGRTERSGDCPRRGCRLSVGRQTERRKRVNFTHWNGRWDNGSPDVGAHGGTGERSFCSDRDARAALLTAPLSGFLYRGGRFG